MIYYGIDLLKDFKNDAVADSTSAKALRDHAKRLVQEYRDRESEWSSWVISEDSVRVRTTKYSFAVLTIAIVSKYPQRRNCYIQQYTNPFSRLKSSLGLLLYR
jgi:hypothetical protein